MKKEKKAEVKEKLVLCRDGKLRKPGFDENGYEVLDPTPIEIPLGWKRPRTVVEMLARMVKHSKMLEDETREGPVDFKSDDLLLGEEDDSHDEDEDEVSKYLDESDINVSEKGKEKMMDEEEVNKEVEDSFSKLCEELKSRGVVFKEDKEKTSP